MSKYDINKARQAMQSNSGGRQRDPNEFIPPKVKRGDELNFRFFILPPYAQGEQINGGPAKESLETFFVLNGTHFVNNAPLSGCPRVTNGEDCELCTHGFDLMKDAGDNKEKKSQIAKMFMPGQRYAVNIYFPKDPVNPEALWGKVMWFNGPKTAYDEWEATLMRDSGGDALDPQAFGIFFDETAAILFQLKVTEKNGYNSYEGSRFLPKVKVPVGFKKSSEGKLVIDEDKTSAILAQRHDLRSKITPVESDKITAHMAKLLGGDSTAASATQKADSGFSSDEQPAVAPVAPKTTQKAPVKTQKPAQDVILDGEGLDIADVAVVEEKPAAKAPAKATAKAPAKDKPKEDAPAPTPAPTPAPAVESGDGLSASDFEDILGQIE